MRSLSKAENKHYINAVFGSGDGIWDWDLRTDKIYLSENLKKILGYTDNQIGSNPQEWISRIYYKDRRKFKSKLQNVLVVFTISWSLNVAWFTVMAA